MPDISEIIEKQIKQKAVREHEITYDSATETLEPIYFWTLDMMNGFFGGKVEKLVDNFSASPGSGYFSELSQKKTIMQKNVTETLGTVNTVIKSIVNIIYDLKDFEIRLEHYDAEKSSDKNKSMAGNLALKQIWMDNVDIKRGAGSINALASGNLQFVTLRDAFMIVNTVEEVKKLELNERVQRILEPRISEFNEWKKLSEMELRKRFSIEKNYLKSQVNLLQLYARWVKPYLKAATQLEMKDSDKNPALVTAFSTTWLELTLMGKNAVNFEDAQLSRDLPKKVKKPKRDYYSVLVVEFKFRGIPQKTGQHFTLGGRAIFSFKAYALNSDEVKLLEQEIKKSDLNDVLKLIEGGTTESLEVLKKDIDYFLNKEDEKEAEEKKKYSTENPFSALFSFVKKEDKKKEEKKKEDNKEIKLEDIKKDSYIEKIMRNLAEKSAKDTCFTIYDVYKKAHGMASHDSPFE
ncbi:MAG: hypothetical protein WC781_00875 [Candidatus Pacearchaeota archaeon]|jgi:hypothetical protein